MDKLKAVPEEYLNDAKEKGRVVSVEYKTKGEGGEITKYAYVYLPYGYDESKEYDILYCLHGGGGEIEVYFGDEDRPAPIKKLLDNMIEKGIIKPIIAVSPTYYSDRANGGDMGTAVSKIESFCREELVNDLIPAVEGKYSTYAKAVDRDGIKASRSHRAYTGYSMGSLSTWYTFANCLEYFRYFMPMSGDCWVNGESDAEGAADMLEKACEKAGYGDEDFFIYAVTGDKDIAYQRMKAQIEAMKKHVHCFKFAGDSLEQGNICFFAEPGATHDYVYMPLYFYNALPHFWK